ncbi:MAG: enoyl-CoA hydratase-related protein [Chloroflexota bacterium]|jgi:methylglutaconyl-CoA hydratase|nr:enoyl-CoA hydratase-related protein [Chloroflexota bacterium]
MTTIEVARDGAFARVTLNRPEVRNAFNAEMIGELRSAFEALGREPAGALRGVVLSGAGPVFSAGADVEWMRSSAGLSVDENERDAAAMQAMFSAIDACPVPVITRVQGAALGGGMGLCAVSDLVLATPATTFGFTEAKLGIIPAVISTFVLPKIGETHARALFTTAMRFDAERALRIGLVHEIVTDLAAMDARVDALLADLRAAGPNAVRAAKALVRELRSLAPDEARRHTVRHIAQQRTSAEGQEGLAAFLEKRSPDWTR